MLRKALSYSKAAHKTLMKLTPVRTETMATMAMEGDSEQPQELYTKKTASNFGNFLHFKVWIKNFLTDLADLTKLETVKFSYHDMYRVCHRFRLTKRDDYFWVNFYHF